MLLGRKLSSSSRRVSSLVARFNSKDVKFDFKSVNLAEVTAKFGLKGAQLDMKMVYIYGETSSILKRHGNFERTVRNPIQVQIPSFFSCQLHCCPPGLQKSCKQDFCQESTKGQQEQVFCHQTGVKWQLEHCHHL